VAITAPGGHYVCECCGLYYPIQRPVSRNIEDRMHQSNKIPDLCARCAPHRRGNDDWAAAVQAAEDHARWYWKLAEQKDGAAKSVRAELEEIRVQSAAQVEEAREKMFGAFNSRDSYIRALARISKHHEPAGRGGCSCRRRDCDTLQIIEQPWIRRRINAVERSEGYGEDDAETDTA